MKLAFKIKRTEGVGVKPNCDYVKYIGKSRIDAYPMFVLTTELESLWQNKLMMIKDALIVNTRPGYTVENHEIEWVKSLEDHKIPAISPIPLPSGKLFYVDYQYGSIDASDERILLML
jgi:hypothetical protein